MSAAPARIHETHTGIVTLCGDRAYKVKKPIVTDFLDFSTLELRERACARELELNRRLAPDVYLGIAHLVDPTARTSEPVLVMRRMPEDRRLSVLIDETSWDSARLSALVRVSADFHDRARRTPDIDAEGMPEALRCRWRSLLRPLREQASTVIDIYQLARIDYLALRFVDGRAALFTRRIADGMIVDGHGDLLAQDIFDLPDGFRVLDCLDFDDRLRYVDRLDDIAFLAMDLEFRGHGELGARLLAEYREHTGDTAPDTLADHYLAYRALVRAKVDLIRYHQGEEAALLRARRHVALCERHLAEAAVRLVLVGGLPGTGKSTVAAGLAAATGAVVLSSDDVRRELRESHEIIGEAGTFGEGRYSPANRRRVYRELRTRALGLLGSGVSVILDASWTDEDDRRHAEELATEAGADLIALECACPAEIAAARIGARRDGDSEATAEIAAAMAMREDAWSGAVRLDTDRPVEKAVAAALREWRSSAEYELTARAVDAVMLGAEPAARRPFAASAASAAHEEEAP